MAHKFNFNQWYPKSLNYDPTTLGHFTYLLHLGYLIPEEFNNVVTTQKLM